MDISVIVPVFNAENHIESCIKGLLNQQYSKGRCEYLLVDNNSSDRSAEIIKRYPRVRLLSQPKRGSYAARNMGLREAQGDIIAFTDGDCVPRPDWLQRIAQSMENPATKIVMGRREFPGQSRAVALLDAYEVFKASYILSCDDAEAVYGYTNNMAVRRDLIDTMGPFVEVLRGGDVVFIRRAVDRYSCRILAYSREMAVTHLEMTSMWRWYAKMFVYGRSYQSYRKIVASSPLSPSQRLAVMKRVSAEGGFSKFDQMRLFGILSMGLLPWYVGRLSRMLASAPSAGTEIGVRRPAY